MIVTPTTSLHERTHGYTFTKAPHKSPHARALSLAPATGRVPHGFVGNLGVPVDKVTEAELFDVFQPSSRPYFQEIADERKYLTDLQAGQAIESSPAAPGVRGAVRPRG